MRQIKLQGLTKKGRALITKHGPIWNVLSDYYAHKLTIQPATTTHKGAIRHIFDDNDPNFIIVK